MGWTAAQIRAISIDPVRLDLLVELRDKGEPMSTAELETLVPKAQGGINTHLSKMAEGGWIERVGERRGRETKWVTSSEGVATSAGDVEEGPDVALALNELYWVGTQRRINRIRTYEAQREAEAWSRSWVEAAIGFDALVHLTAEDLVKFEAEFKDMITRYRGLGRRAEQSEGPAGVERVFVTLVAVPTERLG